MLKNDEITIATQSIHERASLLSEAPSEGTLTLGMLFDEFFCKNSPISVACLQGISGPNFSKIAKILKAKGISVVGDHSFNRINPIISTEECKEEMCFVPRGGSPLEQTTIKGLTIFNSSFVSNFGQMDKIKHLLSSIEKLKDSPAILTGFFDIEDDLFPKLLDGLNSLGIIELSTYEFSLQRESKQSKMFISKDLVVRESQTSDFMYTDPVGVKVNVKQKQG